MTDISNFEATSAAPVLEHDAQWVGAYRLYFNSSEESPRVWSVDDGCIKNEIKVEEVYIYTSAASRFVPGDVQPKAWLEGFGHIVISGGVAIIEDKSLPVVRNPKQQPL